MTNQKHVSTTEPVKTVEVEAPAEVEPIEADATPKVRISRVERARMALAAAEAKDAQRRGKKVTTWLARRAATMAVLSNNHDKLASVDNELIQLVGHDAYVALALPGPVCDRWTDENSYITLASGRIVTLAALKSFYDNEHDKPVIVEYAGHTYSYPTKDAFAQAVSDNEEEALYGSVPR